MHKILLFLLAVPLFTFAQNDADEKTFANEAFEALKVVNFESTRLLSKNDFSFIVAHRFGNLKNGIDTFFGLDDAITRLNFVYGISDALNVGVSRSSFSKIYEASLKYRIARQIHNGFPVTITGFSAVLVNTALSRDFIPNIEFENKLGYTSQLLISRKVNRNFSVLLAPTVFHEGLVNLDTQDNTQFALGGGARYKITKRWSVVADYGWHLNRADGSVFKNPFSIGFDLETGGHVFQLHFTNSRGINTNSFLGRTDGDWLDGDVFFGFNLNRTF